MVIFLLCTYLFLRIDSKGQELLDSADREGKICHKHETSHQDSHENIIAYIVIFLMIISQTCATLSSQIAGGKVNIFQLTSMRYGVTFLIASVLVIIHRTTVFVEAKYVHKIILIGFLNFVLTNILFFLSSFMSV